MDHADADVALPNLDVADLLIGQPLRHRLLHVRLNLVVGDVGRRTHLARRIGAALRHQSDERARHRDDPKNNSPHNHLLFFTGAGAPPPARPYADPSPRISTSSARGGRRRFSLAPGPHPQPATARSRSRRWLATTARLVWRSLGS